MRGFQKGITLGGRTSGSFNMKWLQKRVAKKICKIFAFLHLHLSPLLGEGVRSRIERFRERVREMSREGSERGRERGE